jgi:L-alanine-DL-glutamate epimerase-like enolase superfamily enzyme
VKCHEETEQAQEVKVLEQEEGWGEVAGAAYEAGLPQALVGIAFAQAVVGENPTRPERLALKENAPSAGPL